MAIGGKKMNTMGEYDIYCDRCDEITNNIDYYLTQLGNSEIALLQKIMDKCHNDEQFGKLFCEALRKK